MYRGWQVHVKASCLVPAALRAAEQLPLTANSMLPHGLLEHTVAAGRVQMRKISAGCHANALHVESSATHCVCKTVLLGHLQRCCILTMPSMSPIIVAQSRNQLYMTRAVSKVSSISREHITPYSRLKRMQACLKLIPRVLHLKAT